MGETVDSKCLSDDYSITQTKQTAHPSWGSWGRLGGCLVCIPSETVQRKEMYDTRLAWWCWWHLYCCTLCLQGWYNIRHLSLLKSLYLKPKELSFKGAVFEEWRCSYDTYPCVFVCPSSPFNTTTVYTVVLGHRLFACPPLPCLRLPLTRVCP